MTVEDGSAARQAHGAGGIARALVARIRLRSADEVGARARVTGSPLVRNFGRISIGSDFACSASPIRTHLVVFPGGELAIGCGVVVSHGVSLAVQRRVAIGDGARLGPFVMVMDTHFHRATDWKDGKPKVQAVEIGPGVVIGAGAVVLPGAAIGARARVAPGSVVQGTIPAGAEVRGVPARPPLRRAAGSTPEARIAEVIAGSFGVAPPPAKTSAREIPGWNLLGGLALLLSLEEEFGVALDDDAFARVRVVADLLPLVAAGRSRHPQ